MCQPISGFCLVRCTSYALHLLFFSLCRQMRGGDPAPAALQAAGKEILAATYVRLKYHCCTHVDHNNNVVTVTVTPHSSSPPGRCHVKKYIYRCHRFTGFCVCHACYTWSSVCQPISGFLLVVVLSRHSEQPSCLVNHIYTVAPLFSSTFVPLLVTGYGLSNALRGINL